MRFTSLSTALFFLLSIGMLHAQDVSTLVNSSNKSYESIHWHEDGRIYAIDYNNGRLYQVFLDGTVNTLDSGIPNIVGGGFGDDGSFYYSALLAGTIHRYETNGTITTIASGLNQPAGILQSAHSDTLFVAEYAGNSVVKVSKSTGTITSFVQDNGIDGPDGVIFDEDGNLIVANFNDDKVHTVSLDGTVTQFANLPSFGFTGYINLVGDAYYIPSLGSNKVFKVSPTGVVETFAGNGLEGYLDGPALDATFTNPNGIVGNPAGDTILVTDENRIRMITNFANMTDLADEVNGVNQLTISPNPAKDVIHLSFELQTSSPIQWYLYNQVGTEVKQDDLQYLPAGQHDIHIPVQELAHGIYTVKIQNQETSAAKQIVILK